MGLKGSFNLFLFLFFLPRGLELLGRFSSSFHGGIQEGHKNFNPFLTEIIIWG